MTDRNRQRQRYTEADRNRNIETETERPYSNRTRIRRETCEQAEKGKQADREADIRIGRKSIRRIDRQARHPRAKKHTHARAHTHTNTQTDS